jgi:hypothetical protein
MLIVSLYQLIMTTPSSVDNFIITTSSYLLVQISVNSFFESRGDSVMLRCTINGEGLSEELKQDLTVKKEADGKFC